MVKVKSVPSKKVTSSSPNKTAGKDQKRAISSKSTQKMIKELVKECGGVDRTVGKQACDILHIVLEKHCVAIMKGAQVRALKHNRTVVSQDDVKKEAWAVHAEIWPERFKK